MKRCPECEAEFSQDLKICPHDGTILISEAAIVDPLLDRVFDEKYKIDEKLGGGGMGAVYRGEHLLMNRTVAIKVLHPHLAQDEDGMEFFRRFQREARTASKIRHPNAISIFDFGIEDDIPYLVMEFNEGRSLKQILSEHSGPLPLQRTIAIIGQVCRAIDEAHVHGIIHRDLKPDNIMISENRDGSDNAVVLDFGIAKMLDTGEKDQALTSMTKTGGILGTPQYMSPEQVLGKDLDVRSDIYSLGVILYELITGEVPFDADSSMSLLLKHVNQPPAPIKDIKPDLIIPATLEDVVMRALSKDVEARQQTVMELLNDLSRASVDSTVAVPSTDGGTLSDAHTVMGDVTAANVSEKKSKSKSEAKPSSAKKKSSSTEVRPSSASERAQPVAVLLEKFQALDKGAKQILGGVSALLVVAVFVLMVRGPSEPTLDDRPSLVDATSSGGTSPQTPSSADENSVPSENTGETATDIQGASVDPAVLEAFEYGVRFKEEKNFTAASKAFNEAIRLNLEHTPSYRNLGDVYISLGKLNEAVQVLKNAVRLEPDHIKARATLAYALGELNRTEEAVAEYLEVIRLKPGYALAHNNLGYSYYQLKDYSKAIQAYKNSIRLDPNYARAHRNIGDAYRKQQKWDEAIVSYKESLRLDPTQSRDFKKLGDVYVRVGRDNDAIEAYRTALRIDPEYDKARQNLERLTRRRF